jgi:hypothetical protein
MVAVADDPAPARRPASWQRWLTLPSELSGLLILVSAVVLVTVWLDLRQAWLLTEVSRTIGHDVWQRTGTASAVGPLSLLADWQLFDRVSRTRQISDLVVLIDVLSWPTLTAWFGPHPSLTPSSVLAAILAPALLYGWARQSGLKQVAASALTCLFLLSPAFLSLIVVYFWPAKKVVLLMTYLALFLAARCAGRKSLPSFVALLLTLYLANFVDELAPVSYLAVLLIYAPELLVRARWWQRIAVLSVPLLVVASVTWGLPWLYALVNPVPWSAAAGAQAGVLLARLSDPAYYVIAAQATARALSMNTGIVIQDITFSVGDALVLLAFLIVIAVAATLAVRHHDRLLAYRVVASAVAYLAASAYISLVESFAWPAYLQFMSGLTFYYRTPVVVLIAVSAGFCWRAFGMALGVQRGHWERIASGVTVAALVLCAVVATANVSHFRSINVAVQVVHWFPYTSRQLYAEMRERIPRSHQRTTSIHLELPPDPDAVKRDAVAAMQRLYGEDWLASRLGTNVFLADRNPFVSPDDIVLLVQFHYPGQAFTIEAGAPGGPMSVPGR